MGGKSPRLSPASGRATCPTGPLQVPTKLPKLRLSPPGQWGHGMGEYRRSSHQGVQAARNFKRAGRHHPTLNATLYSPTGAQKGEPLEVRPVMMDVHNRKETFYSVRVGAAGRVQIQPPGTGDTLNADVCACPDSFSFQEVHSDSKGVADSASRSGGGAQPAQPDGAGVQVMYHQLYPSISNLHRQSSKGQSHSRRLPNGAPSPRHVDEIGGDRILEVDEGAEKHRKVLQKAMRKCGSTLQKTWK